MKRLLNKIIPISLLLVSSMVSMILSAENLADGLKKEWTSFKLTFNKLYSNQAEENQRRQIWIVNYKRIVEHNRQADAGKQSYRLAISEQSDLTLNEVIAKRSGFVKPFIGVPSSLTFKQQKQQPKYTTTQRRTTTKRSRLVSTPASLDWRTKGAVTPVKNQGLCSACWAFSAIGAIEGQWFKKTGKLVSLSAQNLVDCVYDQSHSGCNGGSMDDAFDYVIVNAGIDSEQAYPFQTSAKFNCRYNASGFGAKISDYNDLSSDEDTLLRALLTVGPISAAVDDQHDSFQ